MKRIAEGLVAAVACGALGACAYTPTPLEGPTELTSASSAPGPFRAEDFAWSTRGGSASIQGELTYHGGGQRYVCEGGDVILTPETAWSRRRMIILYGAANAAAAPVSIVRARTPGAPSGDYARFVRKTSCDSENRFEFRNLPDGSWFLITVAKPAGGGGESVAVTRRVQTRGGLRSITLN